MTDIDLAIIKQLRQTPSNQKLDSDIISMINSSTLGIETLLFISTVIEHVKPRLILEFGSGLSTLFFARALTSHDGATVYSIENSEFYFNKTKEAIAAYSNVKLFCCPIRPYQHKLKRFLTYDNSYLRRLPKGKMFDLILIDGPLANRYGREATLYQVAPFVSSKTLILVDDANRHPEQTAIANWGKVWADGLDLVYYPELKKGLAVLQIKKALQQKKFPFGAREIYDSWRLTRKIQRQDKSRSANEN
ncbi:MAG TPA: class I SAM-dependent methyltransferase [Anaerolineales bacterium]|nr:class I SAM-dependent methyltransferase [Anaerolineales bacterium]